MVGIVTSRDSDMRYPLEPLTYWISIKPLNYWIIRRDPIIANKRLLGRDPLIQETWVIGWRSNTQ
ncbi:unnamed protein product [Musa textilis]